MNPIKLQSLQKYAMDQSGLDRLILNDLILGYDGARIVADMIPHYHRNINHIEIRGNNLDGQSFAIICQALTACQHLQSINAEWNSIGLSPAGLNALANLVNTSSHLQFIDLKNNRITHDMAQFIADIISINNQSLRVIDLRWNEIGEIGAKVIIRELANNPYLKFIGLEDNKVSPYTLLNLEEILRNQQRGQANIPSHIPYPISQDNYLPMEQQLKAAQLRNKIENQHKQTSNQKFKIENQIQKTLQKISLKAKQIHQSQIKYKSLTQQNMQLLSQLRQAESIATLEKERMVGIDKALAAEKSNIRKARYQMNQKIQSMMEKYTQKHQRDISEIELAMSQKMEKMQSYLRDKMNEKRHYRDKLTDLKEDIIKIKMAREIAWDKISQSTVLNYGTREKEHITQLQNLSNQQNASSKNEHKKGNYLSQQLTNLIMKGLTKEEKLQEDIHNLKNKIKTLHNDMTQANMNIQNNYHKNVLLEATTQNNQADIEMRKRYLRYLSAQNDINCDIEKLKGEQQTKAERLKQSNLQQRILDVEMAVRAQLSQNKQLKNHYQKMSTFMGSISKKVIHQILFGV